MIPAAKYHMRFLPAKILEPAKPHREATQFIGRRHTYPEQRIQVTG